MKKNTYLLALFPLLIAMQLQACPTCIGRLEGDTPPFFSKEYDLRFWPANDTAKTKSKSNHAHKKNQPKQGKNA
jgi:hypothetical protein